MTVMPKIKPSECFSYLDFMVGIRRCKVWFHGPSGVGKTQIQEAWLKYRAEQLGLIYFKPTFDPETGGLTTIPEGADPKDYFGDCELRAILMDVLDIKGAAYLDKEENITRFLAPSILPNVHRHGWYGTMRLDEIAQAFPAVSNAFTQLFDTNKIGDSYVFPPDWNIIATGNRKEDNAATQKAGAHVYQRFDHVEITPNVDDLARYLRRRGGDQRVSSFVAHNAELLHQYKRGDIVFPTPRKWEEVALTAEAAQKAGLSKSMTQLMIASHVGTGPAATIVGFFDICDQLISYEQVIDAPNTAPTPDQQGAGGTAGIYAMMNLLTRKVKERDMDAVMVYIDRLPPLFQSTFMLDIMDLSENEIAKAKKDPATPVQYRFLMQCQAVTIWRKNHPQTAV